MWIPAWAELSLIHSGCGENMEGLEEKRLSLGDLGLTLQGRPPLQPSVMKSQSCLVQISLFNGGCEGIHFIWGEPWIKYLL